MKKKTPTIRKPQRRTIIKKINAIISEYGNFTTADVQANSSPCISSKKGRNELIESFELNRAEVIVTDGQDEEIDRYTVEYKNLSIDILNEILYLAEDWDVASYKTESRCAN